jgi:hypothetical protein
MTADINANAIAIGGKVYQLVPDGHEAVARERGMVAANTTFR